MTAGTLKTIAGPMYAGKTSAILKLILWINHCNHKVVVLKPNIDNRYSKDNIETHNRLSFPCFAMESWQHALDNHTFQPYNYNTVFIDEIQFMDTKETVDNVTTMLERGIHVVAAGLDQDSAGVPFETTAMLLALSDEVEKIQAVCTQCGKPATKTQRLEGAEEGRVLVGSKGTYEPRCVTHWEAR